MALYLDPPSGAISWQKLENLSFKRLDFIIKMSETKGDLNQLLELLRQEGIVANSECLIVGSAKDKVSHFTLRLLMGGDPEMQSFLCQAETTLFDLHFSSMNQKEMNTFFHKLDRVLHHRLPKRPGQRKNIFDKLHRPSEYKKDDTASIFRAFNNIRLCAGSWNEVTRLYMEQNAIAYFSLPFQFVLPLVAKRQVNITSGFAQVPFNKLREAVRELYLQLMEIAAKQAECELPATLGDERAKLLWMKIKHHYRQHHPSLDRERALPGLTVDLVHPMANTYPLCMSSLLQSLRHKHRLGHHARIQLTLFLKDMGLPVHHAIAMWHREYSQTSGVGSQCSHTWEKDGRRYTYGIRHLYGLEGSRRSYRGHCCKSLQQRSLGANEEGGCPFAHWDETTLTTELTRFSIDSSDIAEILAEREAGHFTAACWRSVGKLRLQVSSASPKSCSAPLYESHGASLRKRCSSIFGMSADERTNRTKTAPAAEKSIMSTYSACEVEDISLPRKVRVDSSSVQGNCTDLESSKFDRNITAVLAKDDVQSLVVVAQYRSQTSGSKFVKNSTLAVGDTSTDSIAGRCTWSSTTWKKKREKEEQQISTSCTCPNAQCTKDSGLTEVIQHSDISKKKKMSCMAVLGKSKQQSGKVNSACVETACNKHSVSSASPPSYIQSGKWSKTVNGFSSEENIGVVELEDCVIKPCKRKIVIVSKDWKKCLFDPKLDTLNPTISYLVNDSVKSNLSSTQTLQQQHLQTMATKENMGTILPTISKEKSIEESEKGSVLQELETEPVMQCFQHAVCQSQNHEGPDVLATPTSGASLPSLTIFKPVHYFQLSYQKLLDSLKT